MALMTPQDSTPSGAGVNGQGSTGRTKMAPDTKNPAGTGLDPANPSAGGTRPDAFQARVYGNEYANPERWGPARPPRANPVENTAGFEADENYRGGDRQPQMREASMGPMGLDTSMAREDMSPTMRGETSIPQGGAYRDKVGDTTWEGQTFTPRSAGLPSQGASAGADRSSDTPQTVNIRDGGARAGGMIGLPAHMAPPASSGKGRKA